MNDPIFLLRKEKVGLLAIVCWTLGFLLLPTAIIPCILLPIAWFLTAYWIGMDASYRKLSSAGWVLLWIFTCPLALLIYFLSRPAMPSICYRCGNGLADSNRMCASCGYQSYMGRIEQSIRQVVAGLADPSIRGSVEGARHTAKYMSFALGGFLLFSLLFSAINNIFMTLVAIVFAAFWACTAWWVYLDAKWRRMDAIPWAVLALATNLFGLVTYLVIRYPDPRSCPNCGSALSIELKCCPYCGSETERSCPRCQSAVKADWVYCPACSTQLPPSSDALPGIATHATPVLSIRGTVIDGATGSPLQGAEVRIDSRTEAIKTVTDPLGRFVLADLDIRPYVLLASCEGYGLQPKPFMPDAVKPEQVHFTLYPAPPA
jgi:hypothetical protein